MAVNPFVELRAGQLFLSDDGSAMPRWHIRNRDLSQGIPGDSKIQGNPRNPGESPVVMGLRD